MQSAPKVERRFIEFRADNDGLSGTVIRYGDVAAFGDFTERFASGSIRMDADIVANIMHDRAKPVARIGAGLTLSDTGGAVEARIAFPETSFARDAKELVEARILRGFSIEFMAIRERMEGRERIIEKARMTGLGIVDRPAYPDSVIADRIAELQAAPAPTRKRRTAL